MSKRKVFTLVLAVILLLTCAVSGVLAWLSAKTDPVTNTFSPSTIGLTLDEYDYVPATNSLDTTSARVKANNDYKLIPGWSLPKDPTVTVNAGSVDCYVFLKVEKTNNPDTYLDYTINTANWTAVEGQTNVYYKKLTNITSDVELTVLTNNEVTVKSSLTQSDLEALATSGKNPELKFTAYAVQLYKDYNVEFSVADAWTEAQKLG